MKTFIVSFICTYLLLLSSTYAISAEGEGVELQTIYKKPNQTTTTTTTTQLSPQEIVNDLDKAIHSKLFWSEPASQLESLATFGLIELAAATTELATKTNIGASLLLFDTDMDAILHVIEQSPHSESFNPEIINALREKSAPFNTFVKKYVSIAYQDIANVTSATLPLIENPVSDQPSQKLNALPLALKKYIMKKALDNIIHSLFITIPNTSDLCEIVSDTADLAAAVESAEKKSALLWSLKTLKHVATFKPSGDNINDLIFNKDGSRLAVASHTYSQEDKSNTSYVDEWDTQSHMLCFSVKKTFNTPISSITYLESNETQRSLLILHDQNNTEHNKVDPIQSVWNIGSDNKPIYAGSAKICNLTHLPLKYKKDTTQKYSVTHNYVFSPGTQITKHNCSSLYLCEKATERVNSKKEFSAIKQSQSHAALVEFEKNMIEQQMQEKRAALKQLKSRQPQDTRRLLTKTHLRTQTRVIL